MSVQDRYYKKAEYAKLTNAQKIEEEAEKWKIWTAAP